MTTERLLQTAGKRTFVNCFEVRKNKGRELSEVDVMDADAPYPDKCEWTPDTLTTKTYAFNRIFNENREQEALKICCESKRLSNLEKAQKLYEKYYGPIY